MKSETLQIEKSKALTLFNKSSDVIRGALVELLGEQTFNMPIKDRLKTWEDACKIKNWDPVLVLPFPSAPDPLREAVNGVFQMFVIADLLCEGWVADFTNEDQVKWQPYFIARPAGFGLVFDDTYYWYTRAAVGARLVFPTSELAEYAGKQFIDIYNKFLTKTI